MGNNSSDYLSGGAGNDYFVLKGGVDTIFGGAGENSVQFSDDSRTIGINVNLTKNQTLGSTDTYRVINDGFGNVKYLDGVQNIVGTSFNDTIFGNSESNKLIGGAGDDTLRGGTGSNYLDGGTHTDLATGGGDWAWFDDIAGYGVNISVSSGLMSNAQINTNTNILNSIEHIKGTGQADIIATHDVHNTI